jgi:putative transposase
MKPMAGRRRHSAEDIVRKLRRADELSAEGKTGEEVAAELSVAMRKSPVVASSKSPLVAN